MKKIKSVEERQEISMQVTNIKVNINKTNSVAALRAEVEKLVVLVESLCNY